MLKCNQIKERMLFMRDLKECCFFCAYFCHANPDDDICMITNEIVYADTPKCDNFEFDGE